MRRRTAVLGALAGVGVLGAMGALAAGAYDVSATARPSALEKRVATAVRDASIRARAPRGVHAPADAAVLAKGREEYVEHCLVCHGVPDGPQSSVAAGLNPPVPDLAEPETQARTDGELFQIVSRGIRLSGMPAFERSEPEDVRWALVAFVRRLPRLDAADRAALAPPH